jgi:hypothetical protein
VVTRPGPGTIDFALRSIRGGKREIMEYAGLAMEFEPRMVPIVATWHRLTPWQQRVMTVDALVAQVGGLTPCEFIVAVTRAAFDFTGGLADLCVAAALPDVIKRTVRSAKRLNSRIGQRDRHALLTHAGFLPTPQPVSVRLRDSGPTTPSVEPDMPAFLKAPIGEGETET